MNLKENDIKTFLVGEFLSTYQPQKYDSFPIIGTSMFYGTSEGEDGAD